MALHPTWTPAEIQSALMTTGVTNGQGLVQVYKEDGTTPADWFDIGGGRIDLSVAGTAGFLMNESIANYVNANPATGGDPKTLNLASMGNAGCNGTCSWSRTIRSPLSYDVDWTVTVEVPAGMTLTVTPSSFTLPGGGTQVLNITADASGLPAGMWSYAQIYLEPALPTPLNVNLDLNNSTPVVEPMPELAALLSDSGAKASVPSNTPDAGTVNLVVDDGSQENNIGLTSGGQFLWLNRFTPAPGEFPFTLDEVQILFDTGIGVNVGEIVDVYIYSDADGNPANGATWEASYTNLAVQATDGTTWSVYDLGAGVDLTGPGDVLIAVVNRTAGTNPGEYPASIDQTASQQRSWVGIYNAGNPGNPPTLPADAFFNTIDNAGLPGNWMVRGSGEIGGGTPILPASAHLPVAVMPIGAPPMIDVAPGSLQSTLETNQTDNQTLTIANQGQLGLTWNIFEDVSTAPLQGLWSENFDSYATGQDLHGINGWKGWSNDPNASASTSADQASSAPNSVNIFGNSDLVHEYTGASMGRWTYSTMVYVPNNFAGDSYFILLNTYDDSGATNSYSNQIHFNGGADIVISDADSSTTPLIRGQWVELRVEIDFVIDQQNVYYNGQLFSTASWTNGISPNGALNVGAIDLYANGATPVYYDDMSLSPVASSCDFMDDISWASVSPTSGSLMSGDSQAVQVTFDSTGLAVGTYTGTLCVTSNDPVTPLIEVPLTLDVVDAPTMWWVYLPIIFNP
jgi:hypothetical protein